MPNVQGSLNERLVTRTLENTYMPRVHRSFNATVGTRTLETTCYQTSIYF